MFKDRIQDLRRVRAGDLKPHPLNWRVHGPGQISALRALLSEVGWVDAVKAVVLPDGSLQIVDGHMRAGINPEEEVPVLVLELDEAEAATVIGSLDPIGDLASVDQENLRALLERVELEDGELLALMRSQIESPRVPPKAPAPRLEEAAELLEKWKVCRGDLWTVASRSIPRMVHRILCGDSTAAADVRRLMDGRRSALFSTDPPYLVDYDGVSGRPGVVAGDELEGGDPLHDWDKSEVGSSALYDGFISVALKEALSIDAAWYCWHASRNQAMVEAAWSRAGAFVHQQIVWIKDRPVIGRSWYMWQHEPVFFGWVRGHRPPRKSEAVFRRTVWRIPGVEVPVEKKKAVDAALRRSRWEFPTLRLSERTLHPTPKPPEVFAIPMLEHTSVGDVCFEPFSGSGAQLVAGELYGRAVYAMELEPIFVAVALQRLVDMGLEPVRAGGQ